MIKLGSGALNAIYPVGSIYLSVNSTNPSELFGGTWELLKIFTGGELLAYGWAYNGVSNTTDVNVDVDIPFSGSKIPSKQYSITNYVDGVLTFDSGTFRLHTKNLVGLVEAIYTLSGVYGGNGALWFKGNSNELPTGVTIHNNGTGPILGNANSMYNGASRTYLYKIDDNASDVNFFINPIATVYNSSFKPCSGGVKCELLVKVYAKKQITYMWKRTA